MTTVRLVKVHVQPIFVLDHGTHLEEVAHPPVTIPAADWPGYSGQRFPAEVEAWQQQISETENGPGGRSGD